MARTTSGELAPSGSRSTTSRSAASRVRRSTSATNSSASDAARELQHQGTLFHCQPLRGVDGVEGACYIAGVKPVQNRAPHSVRLGREPFLARSVRLLERALDVGERVVVLLQPDADLGELGAEVGHERLSTERAPLVNRGLEDLDRLLQFAEVTPADRPVARSRRGPEQQAVLPADADHPLVQRKRLVVPSGEIGQPALV